MKYKNILIIMIILVAAIAAFSLIPDTATLYAGTEEYSNSGLDGDTTLAFDTPIITDNVTIDVSQNQMTNTLTNGEIFTKRVPITTTGGTKLCYIDYDADMNSDFSDVRVVSSTGTPLSQMFNSVTNGDSCELWVTFPTSGTYYLVYGNSNLEIKDDTITIPYETQSGIAYHVYGDSVYYLMNTFTFTPDAGEQIQPYNVHLKKDYGGAICNVDLYYRIDVQYGSASPVTVRSGSVDVSDEYTHVDLSFTADAGAAGETVTVKIYGMSTYKVIYTDSFAAYARVIEPLSVSGTEQEPAAQYTISATVNGETKSESFEKETKSFTFAPSEPVSEIVFNSDSANWGYDADIQYADDYSIYASLVSENIDDEMLLSVDLGTDNLNNVSILVGTTTGQDTIVLNDSGNGIWTTQLRYTILGNYEVLEYIINEKLHQESGLNFEIAPDEVKVVVEDVSSSPTVSSNDVTTDNVIDETTEIVEEENNYTTYVMIAIAAIALMFVFQLRKK